MDGAGVAEEPVVMRILFRQTYMVKYFQIHISAEQWAFWTAGLRLTLVGTHF